MPERVGLELETALLEATGPLVRHFQCSDADRIAVESIAGRPVTSTELRAAVEEPAVRAAARLHRAADALKRPRGRGESYSKVSKLFEAAFGARPDHVPSWRPKDKKWDCGDVVRARLNAAARFIESGAAKYYCWGPHYDDPAQFTPDVPAVVKQSSVYLAREFWRAWRAGNSEELAEALIFIAIAGAVKTGPESKGFRSAQAYLRFVGGVPESGEQTAAPSSSAPPRAQSGDPMREAYEDGVDLYAAKKYREAIVTWKKLLGMPGIAENVRSAVTFNIAVCHERLCQVREAISVFEQYLKFPGIDDRAEVVSRIESWRQILSSRSESEFSPGLGLKPFPSRLREFENGQETVAETLRRELERTFRDPGDPGLHERRKRLRALFQSLFPDAARQLYQTLGEKATSDPLSRLFHYKLASATRRELLGILRRKFEPSTGGGRTPSGPEGAGNPFAKMLDEMFRTMATDQRMLARFTARFRRFLQVALPAEQAARLLQYLTEALSSGRAGETGGCSCSGTAGFRRASER